MTVWLDKWSIKVGDSLTQKITEGISEGDFLIIVLSNNSVQSDWVKKELSISLMIELERKSVFILPVRLDDCQIPLIIRDKKYADFRTNFDDGMDELLDAIGSPQTEADSSEIRPVPSSPDIQELADSLLKLSDMEQKSRIHTLSADEKRKLIGEVLDRFSLTGEDTSRLLPILELAILADGRPSPALFEDFMREFAYRRSPARESLARVVANYVEFSNIRASLKDHKLIDWLVTEFERSSTFAQGGANSEIVSNLGPVLIEGQFKRIVDAAIANDQIHHSWGAPGPLRRLFSLNDKWLTRKQKEELKKLKLL